LIDICNGYHCSFLSEQVSGGASHSARRTSDQGSSASYRAIKLSDGFHICSLNLRLQNG
jgi:hypothetical protein